MKNGWIKLWRQSIDSAVWKNEHLWRLWTYCLLKANHKEKWVKGNGIEPTLVKPGQFICSRFTLADALETRTGSQLSPIQWWRYLKKLEKLKNVNIKVNNRFSLVTIVKWEKYQADVVPDEQPNEHQMNNRRTSDEQQMNTNKNDKNDKNEKKTLSRRKKPTMLSSQNSLLGNMAKKYKAKYKSEPIWSKGDVLTFHKMRKVKGNVPDDIMLLCFEDYLWDDFSDYFKGHPLHKFCKCIDQFLEGKL